MKMQIIYAFHSTYRNNVTSSEADVVDTLQNMMIINKADSIICVLIPYGILIFITFGRAVHRNVALNSLHLYVLYPSLSLLRISHADCGEQLCHLAKISWQVFNLDDPQTFSAVTCKTPAKEVGNDATAINNH